MRLLFPGRVFIVKKYFDGSGREIVDNNKYAYGSGHELVNNNSDSYGSGHELVDNNSDSYGSGHEFVDNNNSSWGKTIIMIPMAKIANSHFRCDPIEFSGFGRLFKVGNSHFR